MGACFSAEMYGPQNQANSNGPSNLQWGGGTRNKGGSMVGNWGDSQQYGKGKVNLSKDPPDQPVANGSWRPVG